MTQQERSGSALLHTVTHSGGHRHLTLSSGFSKGNLGAQLWHQNSGHSLNFSGVLGSNRAIKCHFLAGIFSNKPNCTNS